MVICYLCQRFLLPVYLQYTSLLRLFLVLQNPLSVPRSQLLVPQNQLLKKSQLGRRAVSEDEDCQIIGLLHSIITPKDVCPSIWSANHIVLSHVIIHIDSMKRWREKVVLHATTSPTISVNPVLGWKIAREKRGFDLTYLEGRHYLRHS
jgi:hypothetical protein